MKNVEIAGLFETMADVMEINGENAFRVNSYRKMARVLRDLAEDIETLRAEGRLTDLPGVGKGGAEKIAEFLDTGRMSACDRLLADFPASALDLLRIPGLGPKTVGRLMREKGIVMISDLDSAIERGQLDGMRGLGAKSIENIRKGIEFLRRSAGRTLLGTAWPMAQELCDRLRTRCGLSRVDVAGSLRRMRETIGDVDLLAEAEADDGAAIVEAFGRLEGVAEVLVAGETKGSVRTDSDLQVDLRVVGPVSYGAALVYFTGSKAHNVNIRGRAHAMGLKINEYGVYRGEERVAGRTEEDVYAALGLPWMAPALREDRGEVEAAAEGKLPHLLELADIRSDLHVHSDYSDGLLPVAGIAAAAREHGYSCVAITDHSQSLTIADGLSVERLHRRQEEIEAAREAVPGFTILSGTEVDILRDGTLDYPDEILAELDWVIASVHSLFNMGEAEMTRRIIAAAANPHVDAIGHPTGRILGGRDAYALDVGALVAACAEYGTALELNAHPSRLDISDVVCRQAKEAGVKVTINTDAHRPEDFSMMLFGVGTARRGWLEKGDVLNCMEPDELCAYLSAV